jgi:peptidoglycan/LPS O-acetylase OafA/YrhL
LEDKNEIEHVHFYNLDILRFVAAFMIVVLHGYGAFLGWIHRPAFLAAAPTDYSLPSKTGFYVERFIDNLSLGVDFFFLISGFLITYLLLKERQSFGKIHIGKFYIRRALRIWPLYFFIIAIAHWWVKYMEMPEPIYRWTALFANNFQAIVYDGIKMNGVDIASQYPFMHFWSVCVEEHFYLVWPLLLTFIPVKKLPWCFGAIILVSISFRAYAYYCLPHPVSYIYWHTLSKMDILALGGLLAWFHFRKPLVLKIPGWFRLIFYLVAIVALVIFPVKATNSLLDVTLRDYLFVFIFLFLLANYLFNPNAWLNFKKKNFIHYLGKISYGIYIYHNILFLFVIKKIMYAYDLKYLPLFWVAYIAIVVGVSAISYELLEKPFLKLKDRFALINTTR